MVLRVETALEFGYAMWPIASGIERNHIHDPSVLERPRKATAMTDDDPYHTLGVPVDATPPQIKLAYRKLALRHHPDKQRTESDRAAASDTFARISNAYETLSDERRRCEYDMGRRANSNGVPAGERGRGGEYGLSMIATYAQVENALGFYLRYLEIL